MWEERSMRWRWTLVVTGLFAATLWSGPVCAQSPLGLDLRGMDPGGPMLPVLIEGAGLNAAQQAQVRQILANHRPQVQSLVTQLTMAREALATRLYGPDPVSVVDLTPLVQQVVQLRSEEHTSELQSQFHLVCRLLLEKKNNRI